MNVHFSVIVLYLNSIFLIALTTKVTHTCLYHLYIYNDGPVTLDVPVTISAFLECADEDEEYLFVFEDDNKRKISLPGHQTAGATFVFTDKPGPKTVNVRVYMLYPQRMKVASGNTTVEVHVSLRPQLSTVIIPVVCTVLVLLIVASAVVAHLRRSKNYDIETADFDFMVTDESGAVVIETSWEYMRRSFLQLLRLPYIYYTTEVPRVNYGTIFRH